MDSEYCRIITLNYLEEKKKDCEPVSKPSQNGKKKKRERETSSLKNKSLA